jgi:CTP synthase
MSPFEHGEVFVLDDGGEADLDLGNYERFLDLSLSKDNNLTTGKVYQSVIQRERRGDYLGKTVQVVPHVTDAIQDWIERVAHVPVDGRDGCPDVCVIELGGTVGDIESMPFIEALRQFQFRVGVGNMCVVHVSLVPVIGAVGEQKTKPTQHSVATLRSLGLNPSLLACRSQDPLGEATKEKLAQFCHVPPRQVLTMHDVSNIWRVPLMLQAQGAHDTILGMLGLPGAARINMRQWKVDLADKWDALTQEVRIAMVGKYNELSDAYLSVTKALQHACLAASRKLRVDWVDAGLLEEGAREEDADGHEAAWARLRAADGVLVPGGFGTRGVEGKIAAARYAREANKPYLGICLGMQTAVIEFARNVLDWPGAHSTEFDPATPHPVVVFMPEGSTTHMGGTMRLGARTTLLQTVDCISAKLYQAERSVDERHRHRYEVNPELVPAFEAAGLRFVGRDESGTRMEIIELKGHRFFVAAQFHPEFKSRPFKASPLFLGLVLAAAGKLDNYLSGTATPLTSPVKGSLSASPGKATAGAGASGGNGHAAQPTRLDFAAQGGL